MTSHQKKLFPHMPEEIFDPWVDARFKLYGWSYPTGDADFAGWSRTFGEVTLRELAELRWTHGIYQLKDLCLTWLIGTQEMIDFAVHGKPTRYANIKDTKQRFWACADFIRKHNAIPGSLVGVRKAHGIDVWDGGHRLAAVFYLLKQNEKVPKDIPIWVTV